MALITSFANAEKIEDKAEKEISYRTAMYIYGMYWWWIDKVTTEKFHYEGLSKSAALAGQTSLIATYTKNKLIPSFSSEGTVNWDLVTETFADIQAYHVAGGMWSIDVEVMDKEILIEAIVAE